MNRPLSIFGRYAEMLWHRLSHIFSADIGNGSTLVFTQLDFWLFFLLVMVFFSFLHKQKLLRSIYLTVISLFFFYKTSGLYFLLLIVSVTVNYFLGKKIYRSQVKRTQKWIIAFTVIFNLLILGYFKYAYFFTDSFNKMFDTHYRIYNVFAHFANTWAGQGSFVEKILLPVGVSFFTFQNISYVVDVYRKEIKPVSNFFHYSFFVTFFPQLVMGPIVRARDFIPQIASNFKISKEEFSWAVIQIVKGLIKKIVIADFLVLHFIDKIVFTPETYPGFVSILAMWAYSLHIYADFSGYTDIAIGLSMLMGFRLKPNFNSPYKARSVAEFWRRWHISLGSWLRDYLYIPLGGNRTGTRGSYIAIVVIFIFLIFITRWYTLLWLYGIFVWVYLIGWMFIPGFKRLLHRDLNLLITMVLGGLWHGASQNFVMWGAMNGIALIIYKYWRKISFYENSNRWYAHLWKVFLTFNFITFTRIWFKLADDGLPQRMLTQIAQHFNFSWDALVQILSTYQAVFWIMLFGFIVHWLPDSVKKLWEKAFTRLSLPLQAVAVSIIVFLLYQAVGAESAPFVYLQF